MDTKEALDTILQIRYLGSGECNELLAQPKRKRSSFTPLEIVYQLYLYHKNVDRGRWVDIHPAKETIAAHCGVSRSSITNFINSKIIRTDLFFHVKRGKRINGRFEANQYALHPKIKKCFSFLERKGFFKGMKKDRVQWRKWFNTRLEKWLIPLLEKGKSLDQILNRDLNRPSTKTDAKLATVKPAKLADTTLKDSLKDLTTLRHTNNPGVAPSSILLEFQELEGQLRDRLFLPEYQVKSFLKSNSFNILSKAVSATIYWTEGEWKPRKMPAFLQHQINEHKRLKL
jgi:hypothetical protein